MISNMIKKFTSQTSMIPGNSNSINFQTKSLPTNNEMIWSLKIIVLSPCVLLKQCDLLKHITSLRSGKNENTKIPPNLQYKLHLSRLQTCWSLRCSQSITWQCCFSYILIPGLTPGFNGLGKDNCKVRQETFKFIGFGASYIRGLTVYYGLLIIIVFLSYPHIEISYTGKKALFILRKSQGNIIHHPNSEVEYSCA